MNLPTNPAVQELSQLRTRVRLLKQMAGHINSGLGVEQVVERTLLEAHKNLSNFRIAYCTLDQSGDLLVPCAVEPLNMSSVAGKRFPLTAEFVRFLRANRHIGVSDIEHDDRMQTLREMARAAHVRAVLFVSIQHPQGSLAFVTLASPDPHQWSGHEIEVLTDMAEYLAIAIRESIMRRDQERTDLQLRQSQRMEAVGRLVGGVAHDFNNLLTGMMIYSGLLASALGEKNPLQRHVREIQAAGERGASLVGQLLSLSTNHVLERRLLSLNTILDAMREMLQRVVGEEILIECHLAADLSLCRIDENQLRQAILNLAINSRDAMKHGGRLSLHTTNLTVDEMLAQAVTGLTPGDYVVLSVTDTGSGMSAETLAHCFEPFFTTKPAGEGTGLGLAAVYGTMKQHGGSVAVKSALGQGTTLELYFPVADGEPSSVLDMPDRGAATVLLVEDEDLLRLPLGERLKADGYRVLSSHAGQSALETARRYPGVIDLLITDLVMPGMTGTELAERLAILRPETPVLYMSGYTSDPRARRLIECGAHFLRKPFTAEAFTQKVSHMLHRGGLVQPGHQARQQKSISSSGKGT